MAGLDRALNGGWPVGRLCSLLGQGRTSIVGAGVAEVTATGGLVGWIDGDGSLDVKALDQAGADLSRVLWVRGPLTWPNMMAAAEAVTQTDGFEMVIVRPQIRLAGPKLVVSSSPRGGKGQNHGCGLDNTPCIGQGADRLCQCPVRE